MAFWNSSCFSRQPEDAALGVALGMRIPCEMEGGGPTRRGGECVR